MATIKLLPYEVASGAWNMAADEVLLQAAHAGEASLRFYGWSEATVSLGYFQPASARQSLASLPWVRRVTGGLILVHHLELTYALALPASPPWHGKDWRGWQTKMHAMISKALERLGVQVHAVPASPAAAHAPSALCFLAPTPGDLVIEAAKVVGSAQRRQRGALLQHGAVLLAGSPHTPELPGLLELSGRTIEPSLLAEAIATSLTEATGWTLSASVWSGAERARVDELVVRRYGSQAWQDKR